MKGYMFALLLVVALLPLFSEGASSEEITAGKALVEQKIACNDLSEVQLEKIGEYYMELRHPGASHDWVETMMGGEGPDNLRLAHIRMAQVFYCGQGPARTDRYWMIPMMGFSVNGEAWNSGGWNGMMGYGGYGGMMGYGWNGSGWTLNGILFTLLLIGTTVGAFLWVLKLWNEVGAPHGKKSKK